MIKSTHSDDVSFSVFLEKSNIAKTGYVRMVYSVVLMVKMTKMTKNDQK